MTTLNGGYVLDPHGVAYAAPTGGGRPVQIAAQSRGLVQARQAEVLLRQPRSRLALVRRIAKRLDNGGWWCSHLVELRFGKDSAS